MLLVDDHYPECGEAHRIGQKRVGTHDDVHRARAEAGDNPLTFLTLHARTEKFDPKRPHSPEDRVVGDGEFREVGSQRGHVLLGQDFGRCHQSRLAATIDGGQHRGKCHHRFARTHVTLQESVHWQGAGEVTSDVGEDPLLSAGECEAVAGKKFTHESAVGTDQFTGTNGDVVSGDGVTHA